LEDFLPNLQKFCVVFARISGVLSFIPGFGAQFVPIKLRIGLSLILSLVIFPHIKFLTLDFIGNCVTEFLLGCFIGLLARIFFEALNVIATLISLQMGLAHAYSLGLNSPEQSAVFYNFLFLITIFGIFDSGVSHIFIKSIVSSYKSVPCGIIPNVGDAANLIASTVSKSFVTAFKLSSSFIITNITLIIGGGILSRLMPSFQSFLMLTPIQNLVILCVFSVTLQSIVLRFVFLIGEMSHIW
jgi:flagellar biosynthetic protein FliR